MVDRVVQQAVLEAGYRSCAVLTRRYGTTYYWGARLLPGSARRHVHAIYALCRLADDIVDAPGATSPDRVAGTAAELIEFQNRFEAAVDGDTDDPTFAAIAATVRATGIDRECFHRFFAAMTDDLTTTRYDTYEDLLGYMDGSAAVIGEMMLPVLNPGGGDQFRDAARSLGLAFQLTNFLRDVGEDLDRGRVYLPQQDLRRFEVDLTARQVTQRWRDLMAFEIARTRELYTRADAGIGPLPAASGRCVRTARILYSRILNRIEDADYDVFTSRIRVPTAEKAWVALKVGRSRR